MDSNIMEKIKNTILWLLSPFLGDNDRPSIKRFLVLFFAWQMSIVITMRPWDIYTIYVLMVLVVAIGIMQGMTTYQTLAKIFKDPNLLNLNQNKENDKISQDIQ